MENNNKSFELMTKIYSDMQEGFKNVNKEFKKVHNRLDNLERTVIRIENDHGRKFEALFDGYTQNSKKLDRIEKEVTRHEEIIIRRIK